MARTKKPLALKNGSPSPVPKTHGTVAVLKSKIVKNKRKSSKRVSRSQRAGIIFPVGRVDRKLRESIIHKRISGVAAVFMAAIVEYLSTEVVDLALEVAKVHQKRRITPRFLQLAVRGDEDFAKMFSRIMIAQGGVLPTPIHESLLQKKK